MSSINPMQQRLDADRARLAELGKAPSMIDPTTFQEQLPTAVAAKADELGFHSDVAAALHSRKHQHELPEAEQNAADPIGAYHASLEDTIAHGTVVRQTPNFAGGASTRLVIHREVPTPTGEIEVVEAVVDVRQDGMAVVASYGEPKVVEPTSSGGRHAIARLFNILVDPEGEMTAILNRLARANDPNQPAPASSYFANALYGLIALESAKSAGIVALPENTNRFREAMSAALVEQKGNFAVFDDRTYSAALSAANGGWRRACLGRSVLQILLDDFQGTAAAALLDLEEIEETDDLLRAAAPDAAPLADWRIPSGMPANHWWWRLPSGPLETDPEPWFG